MSRTADLGKQFKDFNRAMGLINNSTTHTEFYRAGHEVKKFIRAWAMDPYGGYDRSTYLVETLSMRGWDILLTLTRESPVFYALVAQRIAGVVVNAHLQVQGTMEHNDQKG